MSYIKTGWDKISQNVIGSSRISKRDRIKYIKTRYDEVHTDGKRSGVLHPISKRVRKTRMYTATNKSVGHHRKNKIIKVVTGRTYCKKTRLWEKSSSNGRRKTKSVREEMKNGGVKQWIPVKLRLMSSWQEYGKYKETYYKRVNTFNESFALKSADEKVWIMIYKYCRSMYASMSACVSCWVVCVFERFKLIRLKKV